MTDDRPTADEVRAAGFDRQRDGYERSLVDDLLADVATALDAGADVTDIVPDDPATQLPRARSGYARHQVDLLLARLRRPGHREVVATPSGATLFTTAELVVAGPALVGPDGARLGRVEYAADTWRSVHDADGAIVLRTRSAHPLWSTWAVTDGSGDAVGRVRARTGLTSSRTRRARLEVDGAVVATVRRVGREAVGGLLRRYDVAGADGRRLATVTSDGREGRRVTLTVEAESDLPVRRLLVALAVGPATPLTHRDFD